MKVLAVDAAAINPVGMSEIIRIIFVCYKITFKPSSSGALFIEQI